MKGLQRLAAGYPLPFVLLAAVAWMVVAGAGAALAARLLDISFGSVLAQSVGMLTGTALLLFVMGRWGWLRPAGVARLGSRRLWLVTAFLLAYVIVAYRLAFFGNLAGLLSDVWRSPAGQGILARQAVVGVAEELLFRGFMLYALVRAWGSTRRGILAAVTLPALIFGLLHILQTLGGNPLDDTLMTMLNAFVGGLWLAALVLLGGSLWPAVLLHAAGNAVVQVGALSARAFDPAAADYAAATLAEVPVVIAGLVLLVRRVPTQRAEAGRPLAATARGSAIARTLLLLVLIGVLVLAGCAVAAPVSAPAPTPAPAIETRLSAAERGEIFETVWQTVNEEYFDPTFGGKDWQAIGERYRRMLDGVEDDRTFWLEVLNPMLFELGVSHIGALPPEFSSQMDPMTFSAGTLGMDVRLLDGQVVIVAVVEGFPAAEAGLRPGFVITAMDGRTPAQIAADALQTPPDNEPNRRANLVQTLRARLYGEPGEAVEIGYLDGNERPQRVNLAYAERSTSTCAQFDPSLPPACTEVEARRLPAGAGYIRFSGFLQTALDPVLQAIDDLQDTPALIVDLRGNPGGVFPVRKAIAGKLVGEPELFMRYRLRDGVEEAHLDRVADPYRGRVIILVDELSASSAEEFAGSLQALERATVVGSQTPGRCLVANIVPLPNDAVLIYPFGQSQTPDGRVLEGNGVLPDVVVGLDRGELLEGVDAQLDAAIEFLTGQIER